METGFPAANSGQHSPTLALARPLCLQVGSGPWGAPFPQGAPFAGSVGARLTVRALGRAPSRAWPLLARRAALASGAISRERRLLGAPRTHCCQRSEHGTVLCVGSGMLSVRAHHGPLGGNSTSEPWSGMEQAVSRGPERCKLRPRPQQDARLPNKGPETPRWTFLPGEALGYGPCPDQRQCGHQWWQGGH